MIEPRVSILDKWTCISPIQPSKSGAVTFIPWKRKSTPPPPPPRPPTILKIFKNQTPKRNLLKDLSSLFERIMENRIIGDSHTSGLDSDIFASELEEFTPRDVEDVRLLWGETEFSLPSQVFDHGQENQWESNLPSYTHAVTGNGVNTHTLRQGNNPPSPRPGVSPAPKPSITGRKEPGTAGDGDLKRISFDEASQKRVKIEKKKMESKLEELQKEIEKLKREKEYRIDMFSGVLSKEAQNELTLTIPGEANPWMEINPLNQNQLAPPLCTTSNGANTHMFSQGNHSPSPQPGTYHAPKPPITGRKEPGAAGVQVQKKRLTDKFYRERLKEGRKKTESELRELSEENEDLKRKNESLKKEKDLAEQNLQKANDEIKQCQCEICGLSEQSRYLRILVDAFTQKMFACDNVEQQLKQLKDELASLIEKIPWEDWMEEKLQYLNTLEQLKNQNRILNVQVNALCEKKYKQGKDPVIIRSVE